MQNPLPLQYGCYYHIYNRGNNRENIFLQERNYPYFMEQYGKHISPIADTLAFCLLRNHFHFLVRIRAIEEQEHPGSPKEPSQAFSNLFNAYAKAINHTCDRMGALFQKPFGRIPVTSSAHFKRLIVYIHQNPQKHGFVDDFREWPYSSFDPLRLDKPTFLRRDQVMDWFGSPAVFDENHHALIHAPEIDFLLPDHCDPD